MQVQASEAAAVAATPRPTEVVRRKRGRPKGVKDSKKRVARQKMINGVKQPLYARPRKSAITVRLATGETVFVSSKEMVQFQRSSCFPLLCNISASEFANRYDSLVAHVAKQALIASLESPTSSDGGKSQSGKTALPVKTAKARKLVKPKKDSDDESSDDEDTTEDEDEEEPELASDSSDVDAKEQKQQKQQQNNSQKQNNQDDDGADLPVPYLPYSESDESDDTDQTMQPYVQPVTVNGPTGVAGLSQALPTDSLLSSVTSVNSLPEPPALPTAATNWDSLLSQAVHAASIATATIETGCTQVTLTDASSVL